MNPERPLEFAGLAVATVGGVRLAAVLLRLQRTIAEQAARASALAGEVIRVESRERRALADALHDGAVQQISVALREITSSPAGEPDAGDLALARGALEQALDQLRGEIFTLYPHVLDHAGLCLAAGELVRRAADRGGFAGALAVDPAAAGLEDLAVMAVLRELLANAAKHAGAANVDVQVSNPTGSCIVVEVSDDGRGFAPASPAQAARARQFGLQAAADRLQAVGGSLELHSAPGAGTSATARIPAGRDRSQAPADDRVRRQPGARRQSKDRGQLGQPGRDGGGHLRHARRPRAPRPERPDRRRSPLRYSSARKGS